MEELARQFAYTLTLRPYFFLFFLAYVIGCSLHLGLARALIFAVGGFAVAWSAEHLSIHTGFPFGLYHYTGFTKGLESWVWDVPLIDSASFVFLAWASYSMALLTVCPLVLKRSSLRLAETNRIKWSFPVRALGALLFVYLDIIIDPVALRGDRWFLGSFYYYPEPGVYFGVPLSNFAGWLLVGFVLIWLLQIVDRMLAGTRFRDLNAAPGPWKYLIGPALYFSIIGFNLFMTFWIGEYLLGWVGVFLVVLPSVIVLLSKTKQRFFWASSADAKRREPI
jgi:putative membrane protein